MHNGLHWPVSNRKEKKRRAVDGTVQGFIDQMHFHGIRSSLYLKVAAPETSLSRDDKFVG